MLLLVISKSWKSNPKPWLMANPAQDLIDPGGLSGLFFRDISASLLIETSAALAGKEGLYTARMPQKNSFLSLGRSVLGTGT